MKEIKTIEADRETKVDFLMEVFNMSRTEAEEEADKLRLEIVQAEEEPERTSRGAFGLALLLWAAALLIALISSGTSHPYGVALLCYIISSGGAIAWGWGLGSRFGK